MKMQIRLCLNSQGITKLCIIKLTVMEINLELFIKKITEQETELIN